MRRLLLVAASIFTALIITVLAPGRALAEEALPTPPHGFRPPPPAPVKPYKPVAVTPPAPFDDASFEAFRKNLAGVAARKDRAALAAQIVVHGFFWLQQKNLADNGKPGIDNLAEAIGLDAKDSSGWDVVAAAAAEPTAAEVPQHKGLFCSPAPPTFDPQAIDDLLQQTDTDPAEWAYPINSGTDARADAQPNAHIVDKLGLYLVRVLTDSAADNPETPAFLHVALPSGKTGFVATEALAPLVTDQICYTKEASGWKIAGYIGGVPQ
ncbi:MAG: hypothetical protein ACREH9_00535 [Pseudomonadota bacterium]